MKQLFCVSSWTYITFCIRIWNHWVSQIYRNRGNQKGLGFFCFVFLQHWTCETDVLFKSVCYQNRVRCASAAPQTQLYALCREQRTKLEKKFEWPDKNEIESWRNDTKTNTLVSRYDAFSTAKRSTARIRVLSIDYNIQQFKRDHVCVIYCAS